MTVNISSDLSILVEKSYPSKTYRLDKQAGRISGYVDGQDAYLQFVYKVLQTERYAFLIYGDNHGVEIESLIGQDMCFVKAVLKDKITEALMQDDRTKAVYNFVCSAGKDVDSLSVSFTIDSIYGTSTISSEV